MSGAAVDSILLVWPDNSYQRIRFEGKGQLSNKKIRAREIHNDMRGNMAEMLAKAVDTKALDTGLTTEDTQKFLEYLRAEGGLNIDKLYKASDRRGFETLPGAGDMPPKFSAVDSFCLIMLLVGDCYAISCIFNRCHCCIKTDG